MKCLGCGWEFNGFSDLDGDTQPKPGDLSVCLKCGHVAFFAEGGVMRNPTMLEMAGFAADTELQRKLAVRQHLENLGHGW